MIMRVFKRLTIYVSEDLFIERNVDGITLVDKCGDRAELPTKPEIVERFLSAYRWALKENLEEVIESPESTP